MHGARLRRVSPAVASLCLMLAGCGSISVPNLWPFGESTTELSREPANATAYQCEGGRLYVRLIDDAAWVILPDRELRLDKEVTASGSSYRYRDLRLTLGKETMLEEGGKALLSGCKVVGRS